MIFWMAVSGIVLGFLTLYLMLRSPSAPVLPASKLSEAPSLPVSGGINPPNLASSAPSGAVLPPVSQSFSAGAQIFQPEEGGKAFKEISLPFKPPPGRFTLSELKVMTEKTKTESLAVVPHPHVFSVSEIFHIQYPDTYLEYLKSLQDLMVADGFIASSQSQVFKTHNDVYFFMRNYINYLSNQGALIFKSEEDKNKYIENVLANLLFLNALEANLLEKGIIVFKK